MNLIFKLGIAVLAWLLLFQIFIAPSKQYTESSEKLAQPILKLDSKV
jgi:hypothetical protein